MEQLRESCSSLASQLAAIKQKQREQEEEEQQQPGGVAQQQGEEGLQYQQHQVSSSQTYSSYNNIDSPYSNSHIELSESEPLSNTSDSDIVSSSDSSFIESNANANNHGQTHEGSDVAYGHNLSSQSPSDTSSTNSSGLAAADNSLNSSTNEGIIKGSTASPNGAGGEEESKQYSEISLVKPDTNYRYILEHMKEGDLESTSMVEVLARLNREGG